jgi:predicted transcriptional regulator
MAQTVPTLKQRAHELIDRLPDTATWDDVIEELRFRKEVEAGLAEADRCEFATTEEIRATFAKWGVKLEA